MQALGLRGPSGGAKAVVETEVWSGKVAHLHAAAAVEWRVRQLVGLVWPLAGFLTVSPERKWVLGQSRAARGGGGWSGGWCRSSSRQEGTDGSCSRPRRRETCNSFTSLGRRSSLR
jgi:hypothetical protein